MTNWHTAGASDNSTLSVSRRPVVCTQGVESCAPSACRAGCSLPVRLLVITCVSDSRHFLLVPQMPAALGVLACGHVAPVPVSVTSYKDTGHVGLGPSLLPCGLILTGSKYSEVLGDVSFGKSPI